MEEAYWCHTCSQRVNPVREIDVIKCPICEGGFVEETETALGNDIHLGFQLGGSESDHALSRWTPILLGMFGNPRPHSRNRRVANEINLTQDESEAELGHELELILRRRRSSRAIFHLLQGIRDGVQSDPDPSIRDGANDGGRGRERVILINPFNESAVILGSHARGDESQNRAGNTSLHDYFTGPRLDLLLQHLLENDPNRYGTPPAEKEAVEALPAVQAEETMQCSICLDECEKGSEVKEMPCKHKFHGSCIIPWLELHSSCPICRFQLPCDESKLESLGLTNDNIGGSINQETNSHNHNHVPGDTIDNTSQFQLQLPWLLSSLFPSPRAHRSRGNSSTNDTPGSPAAPQESEI